MALPDVSPYVPTPIVRNNPIPNPSNPNPNLYLPKIVIDKADGYDGAMNYPLGPDSLVIVPDATLPVVWYISTDHNGNKTLVKGYHIDGEYIPPKPVTMEDLLAEMREMKDRLAKMEEGHDDGKSDSRSNGKPRSSWQNNRDGQESTDGKLSRNDGSKRPENEAGV